MVAVGARAQAVAELHSMLAGKDRFEFRDGLAEDIGGIVEYIVDRRKDFVLDRGVLRLEVEKRNLHHEMS